MSTRVTRNSSARFKKNCEENADEKHKIIDLEVTNFVPKAMPFKMPIIAPNGKTLYPCQYCAEVFQRKMTSTNHMKKCPNRNASTTASIYLNKSSDSHSTDDNLKTYVIDDTPETHIVDDTPETHIVDDTHNVTDIGDDVDSGYLNELKTEEILDIRGSSPENNNDTPKIKIYQNATVKAPDLKSGNPLIGVKAEETREPNDISIYDYNEDGMTYSEGNDADSDKKCKRCHEFFENPLDILRHSRTCRNLARKILPLEEVEKYFDSPIRNYCPICEKPIKTRNFRSVFVKHLLVHTVGLTHECNICKKKFRRRDHMRAHHKRHIVCG